MSDDDTAKKDADFEPKHLDQQKDTAAESKKDKEQV